MRVDCINERLIDAAHTHRRMSVPADACERREYQLAGYGVIVDSETMRSTTDMFVV